MISILIDHRLLLTDKSLMNVYASCRWNFQIFTVGLMPIQSVGDNSDSTGMSLGA